LVGTNTNKETAKEAWASLFLRNIGVDHERKVHASILHQEFDSLQFEAGEMVDDFGDHINRLIMQLAVLDVKYTEKETVR
jgi:hypothetical protein